MLRAIMVGAAAFVLLGAAGCDKDDVTEADVQATVNGAVNAAVPKCEPGRALDCACPGMLSGVQVCADDGKRWDACDCPAPTSGSSSSSGSGAGPAMQKIMCDPVKQSASVAYPGLKLVDLAAVRVISHDPQLTPPFHQIQASMDDGLVVASCITDYDLFVGP